jgi:hypothetical protein
MTAKISTKTSTGFKASNRASPTLPRPVRVAYRFLRQMSPETWSAEGRPCPAFVPPPATPLPRSSGVKGEMHAGDERESFDTPETGERTEWVQIINANFTQLCSAGPTRPAPATPAPPPQP